MQQLHVYCIKYKIDHIHAMHTEYNLSCMRNGSYVYLYLLNLSWCLKPYVILYLSFAFSQVLLPFHQYYCHMLQTLVNYSQYSGNPSCDEYMYQPNAYEASVNYCNLPVNSCSLNSSCTRIIALGCTAYTVMTLPSDKCHGFYLNFHLNTWNPM